MIEPEERKNRNFARTGKFWEQKFGCNNQGVIAAFFIAKKGEKVDFGRKHNFKGRKTRT